MIKDNTSCQNVWIDPNSILHSQSIFESLFFYRESKIIKRKLSTWTQEKEKLLNEKEFSQLDKYLSSLCLQFVKDQPPTPPGGFDDFRIVAKKQTIRLGRLHHTGGSHFVLTEKQLKELSTLLEKLGPT